MISYEVKKKKITGKIMDGKMLKQQNNCNYLL